MPFPPPPSNQPGGVLVLEYVNAAAGARHGLRLHLAWFNQSASGGLNDHAYISGGPVLPSETAVSETYTAIAALWQPLYSADWTLHCLSLGYNLGAGKYERLTPNPAFPSYQGTAADPADGSWYVDRVFKLLGQSGQTRRLWLRQIPSDINQFVPFEVAPDHGGVDAHDRAWMAYLSGLSGGGAVMPDGTYCFGVADMHLEWTQPPMAIGTIPGMPDAPYMVAG